MSEEADGRQLLTEGQELFKQGRCQEALAVLDQALALAPNSEAAWSLKGRVLEHLRRYEEALMACEQSLQTDPGRTYALREKAYILRKLKRNSEANEVSNRAFRLASDLVENTPENRLLIS